MTKIIPIVAVLMAMSSQALGMESYEGPAGWATMCESTPQYCNSTPSTNQSLTPGQLIQLGVINRGVNATIIPENEPEGQDVWLLNPARGDCEDYALTKKSRLIQSGFDPNGLRFATLLTEENEYHAVLLVDHNEQHLVLDNRFDDVFSVDEAQRKGYIMVSIEGDGADGEWLLTPYANIVFLLLQHGGERDG